MQAQQLLQEIKTKSGLSLTQIAKKLDITQSTIQRIATGETKNCRSNNYLKILEFYNSQTKTPSGN